MQLPIVYESKPKLEKLSLEVLAQTIGFYPLEQIYWSESFGWLNPDGKTGATVVIPQGTELITPNGKKIIVDSDVKHGFRYDNHGREAQSFRELEIKDGVQLSDAQVIKYPNDRINFPDGIYTLTRPLKDGETEPVEQFYQNLDMARRVLRMGRGEFISSSNADWQAYYKRTNNGPESEMRRIPSTLIENAVQESLGLRNVGRDGIKLLLETLSEMFEKFEELGIYRVNKYFPLGDFSYECKGNEHIPDRMKTLASYIRKQGIMGIFEGLNSLSYVRMGRRFEKQLIDAGRLRVI